MDVLERWFHVNPDGGSGSLELLYLVAAAAAVSAWSLRSVVAARLNARRKRHEPAE
jgi:hypothetical protein